jgi:hypothetical protein
VDPPAGRPSELYTVTDIDGTIWASGNSVPHGLVLRWTGREWKPLPYPPRPPDHNQFLRAIDGTGPDDIWAAGYVSDGSGPDPVAQHWDGKRWTTHRIPVPEGASGIVYGLAAVARDDVWAVGLVPGPQYPPILAHWDGRRWKELAPPIGPSPARLILRSVDALASDDIWAVGTADSLPAAFHWDGHHWRWMRIDQGEGGGDWDIDMLYGVTAIAPDDVWAVGGYGESIPGDTARIVHWDGTTWKTVKTVQVGGRTVLNSISAAAPDDIWAVGSFERPGEDNDHHLYLHWDGDRWKRVRAKG